MVVNSPSDFLDLQSRNKQPANTRGSIPVKVKAVDESGTVEVRIPGSDAPNVVTTGTPGLWATDVEATAYLDASGRIIRVDAPRELPHHAEVIAVGSAAQQLQKHAERLAKIRDEWQSDVEVAKELASSLSAQALDEARRELESSSAELAEQIDLAKSAAGSASAMADSALAQAQAAEASAGAAKAESQKAAKAAEGATTGAAQAKSQAQSASQAALQAKGKADSAYAEAIKKVTADKIVASAELWAKLATFAKVTTPMLIAGNAKITEKLLADQIILKTKIVAGNPDGTHTSLDPQGLKVHRRSAGGQTVEAIRLGASDSEDYLGITSPDGELVSSLDAAGGASFQSLNVKGAASFGALQLNGVDVGEALAGVAHPISYIASDLNQPALNSAKHNAGAAVMLDEHQVTNESDYPMFAVYLCSSINARVESAANGREIWGTLNHRLHFTDNAVGRGTQPSVDSPYLAENIATNQGTGFTSGPMIVPFMVPPKTTRWLMATVRCANTRFSVPNTKFASTVIVFGARPENASLPGRIIAWATDTQYGGYTPPPAKQRHVREYRATWGASYNRNNGGNRTYAYDSDGVVVHGIVPGSNYFNSGLIGFPDMTGDLSGASIEKVEVYLYFTHWYNGSGGTAGVGVHNALNTPGHLVGGARSTQISTRRASGGWVTLPPHLYNGFKSGAYRGILLMANSQNLSEYGLCRWRDAKLRITFTK